MKALASVVIMVTLCLHVYFFEVSEGCPPGFYGPPGCTEECGHCLNGTVCDNVTGECPQGCGPGYLGEMCYDRCPMNTWGPNCSMACGNCLIFHPCDVVTGACGGEGSCAAGYQGPTCHDPCGDNYWGLKCANLCGNCLTFIPCNKINGACGGGCSEGWLPPNCVTQENSENSTQGFRGQGVKIGSSTQELLFLVSVGIVLLLLQ